MTYVVLNGAETTIFDFFLLLKDSRTRELGFDQFSVKVYYLYGYWFQRCSVSFFKNIHKKCSERDGSKH